jgi:TolB-like protein/DNA-binding winged helix-turn-helix (wHTH) protein/Flp pilus assembly protein TadD
MPEARNDTGKTSRLTGRFAVADLVVDLDRLSVTRDGVPVPLPALSFDLLVALARAEPRVLTQDELMDDVWRGAVVSPETVSQRVKLLRDALGDDAREPRYVAVVRARGYRLVAPVVPLPPSPAIAPIAPSPPVAPTSPSPPAAPVVQDVAPGSASGGAATSSVAAAPGVAAGPMAGPSPGTTNTALSGDTAARAPHAVFLSYASEDSAAAARLAASLTAAGVSVWLDRSELRSGDAWDTAIRQQIRECTLFVPLISASTVARTEGYFRLEWALAEERSRMMSKRRPFFVPVVLDDTQDADVPDAFQAVQWIRLPGGEATPAFVARILALLDDVLHPPTVTASHARPEGPVVTPASLPAPSRPATPVVVGGGTTRRTVLLGGAGALALALGGVYAWRRSTSARSVARNGIVVLPFRNLSGNAEQDYFADGLSAELRSSLARNRALRVIAQVSSETLRKNSSDAVQIAASIGVAYLLDGSVRLGSGTFRIAAELIDGTTGFSRWSQTFDRPRDDVLAVQSEIASAVQAALVATLGAGMAATDKPDGGDREHEPGGTDDVAAFDAYLRGRALYDQSDGEASDRAALEQFEAAIAHDPKFAAAHAARSRSLTVIANQYASATQTAALYAEALREARLAVELAPDFAGAHSTLAFTLFQGRLDVAAARAPYKRSRELGAGDATVLGRYALYCALTGRADDALASMRRAAELDPLNPLIHRAVGTVHYAARNYSEVLPNVRHALTLNPKLSGAHAIIGNSLFMLGRAEEARAEYRLERHSLVRLPALAIVERKLGDAAASRAAFDELVRTLGDGALYQQAQVHAQWGEADAAIALLERARAAGDSGLIYLRTDPLLDPIRARPEVKALLQRLGFAS